MIRKSITEIFSVLAPGSTYIHMSSIMAHGMPDGQYALSSFLFARNSYGYIKRKAEKFALRLGQKNGIAVYNFRLSQVHGFLQSVNSVFRAISTQSEVLSNGNKDSLSNTIFIHALGNAILQVVGKKWVPGTYALVSNPQWTLFELYEFYSTRYGIQTKITYLDKIDKSRNKLKDNLFSSIIQRLKPYRQIIETYLLLKIPSYT
jgi:dTDP-4-dehydrorhamnose reductase